MRICPMICNAKDLSPGQKTVIEDLLGRSVRDDEAISVRAIDPPALSDEHRQELVEELRKYFAEVDARRKPGSPEEAEEILTEAIRSTRPGYRPHQ
jgi:hypothetical protein